MKYNIFSVHLISILYCCCQVSCKTDHLAGINEVDAEYPIILYVGSYSPPDGTGSGITIFEQDDPSTTFSVIGGVFLQSPSYMAIDAAESFIYAVSELNDYDGEPGVLWSLRVAHPAGNLTVANGVPLVPGSKPCYVTLDPTGKFLLVANYGSGNVLIYRLNDEGLIGERTSNVPPPGDDSGAKAHMVRFEPSVDHNAAVAYLGLDSVYFYDFDEENGLLTPLTMTLTDGSEVQVRADVEPGSGPRHLVYALDGRYFYVINELASTIAVFQVDIDPNTGLYMQLQTVSTHPDGYIGTNWASEIAISPNGLFLYASERGDNSIAIYSIDTETGLLTSIGFQPTTGETPRYFVIEPSGATLYVANQDSNSIDIFSIDQSGFLTLGSTITDIPSPAFILYEEML